jgi:hypothetical protein
MFLPLIEIVLMLSRTTQRSQVTQYVVISMQVYFPNTLCTLYAFVLAMFVGSS